MNRLTFRSSPLYSVDSCWSLFGLLYSVLWTITSCLFPFDLFCFVFCFMPFYLLGLLGQRAPEFSACFTWVCRISLSSCQISRFLGNLEINICLFRSTFRFFVSRDKFEHPAVSEVKASVHSATTTMRL